MDDLSQKPYLIRAIYEWCVDSGYTPYLLVAVSKDTLVPPAYIRDGQIVLNVSPDATHQIVLGNDIISFQARFGGVATPISVPVANVQAIYARETAQGMGFEVTQEESPESSSASSLSVEDESVSQPSTEKRRSHLKVIK